MVISQTPYRVSFAGGGTDLAAFYEEEPGAVLSVTIARHFYVSVHRRFLPDLRMAYSQTETVARAAQLRHEIAREALRLAGLEAPLEITTIGDVPAGTGLGSSSAVAVGLLNAFYAFLGSEAAPERLAREACQIEIERLGKPIGRQDQYSVSYGGLNYIRFFPGPRVEVEPVAVSEALTAALESHCFLVYTGQQREASTILERQSAGTKEKMATLRRMRDLAGGMRDALAAESLGELGRLLHEGWQLKRSLGWGITDERIDGWYEAARAAGAFGGKLLGAGGGGFMLLLAPPERHERIREALGRPRELPFAVERRGSRIVFRSDPPA
jgi:D-glycero-alpha-D-manno-heptose-7-phosphate kinase